MQVVCRQAADKGWHVSRGKLVLMVFGGSEWVEGELLQMRL